jgi:hypothetical protein
MNGSIFMQAAEFVNVHDGKVKASLQDVSIA